RPRIPRRTARTGAGICRGRAVLDLGVAAGLGSAPRPGWRWDGTSAEVASPRGGACPAFGQGASLVSEPKRPAPGELAGRHARHDAFPLCGLAGARGASGLRAQPTAPRTMVVARVAQAREGADEILAVQPAGVDQPAETGGHGEAAVAHRARLRGTEAGAWTGALRRTQLARLSPPCQLLHCCLRLPGGGAMPFFPHARLPTAACRQPPTSPTPIATRGETSWRCRLERNGIIRIPSLACAARSQPTWRAPCPDVPAACASSYNTVVLAPRLQIPHQPPGAPFRPVLRDGDFRQPNVPLSGR